MNTGKMLLGIFAGFTAGVVLGILFAPEKGEVTRGKIVDTSKKFGEDINKKMGDKFNEYAGSLKGTIKKTFSKETEEKSEMV